MADIDVTVEVESEADKVLRQVISSRGGREAFDIESLATARKYVRTLLDDQASPRDAAELRAALPPVVKVKPVEKTLALDEMADDAPVDPALLSDWQLHMAEAIIAVGQGRACALDTRRTQKAAELIGLLDRHPDVGVLLPAQLDELKIRLRGAMLEIVSPEFTMASLFDVYVGALGRADPEVAALKEKVAQLEHDLNQAQARLSGKVSDLAERRKQA
jgi:hypothetical protein